MLVVVVWCTLEKKGGAVRSVLLCDLDDASEAPFLSPSSGCRPEWEPVGSRVQEGGNSGGVENRACSWPGTTHAPMDSCMATQVLFLHRSAFLCQNCFPCQSYAYPIRKRSPGTTNCNRRLSQMERYKALKSIRKDRGTNVPEQETPKQVDLRARSAPNHEDLQLDTAVARYAKRMKSVRYLSLLGPTALPATTDQFAHDQLVFVRVS